MLFNIQSSQTTWIRYGNNLLPEYFPQVDLKHSGGLIPNTVSNLAWGCFRLPWKELEDTSGDRDIRASCSGLGGRLIQPQGL